MIGKTPKLDNALMRLEKINDFRLSLARIQNSKLLKRINWPYQKDVPSWTVIWKYTLRVWDNICTRLFIKALLIISTDNWIFDNWPKCISPKILQKSLTCPVEWSTAWELGRLAVPASKSQSPGLSTLI